MFNVTMWTNKSVGLKETLHGVKCDNDGSPASLADTVGPKEWPFFLFIGRLLEMNKQDGAHILNLFGTGFKCIRKIFSALKTS